MCTNPTPGTNPNGVVNELLAYGASKVKDWVWEQVVGKSPTLSIAQQNVPTKTVYYSCRLTQASASSRRFCCVLQEEAIRMNIADECRAFHGNFRVREGENVRMWLEPRYGLHAENAEKEFEFFSRCKSEWRFELTEPTQSDFPDQLTLTYGIKTAWLTTDRTDQFLIPNGSQRSADTTPASQPQVVNNINNPIINGAAIGCLDTEVNNYYYRRNGDQ